MYKFPHQNPNPCSQKRFWCGNKSQRKAVRIADRVFSSLKIEKGERERDIAERIKNLLASFDAKPAFRIIVASGKRSANPHGFATGKRIKRGDLVVIDFGALYNGYRSDISRTFVIGKPGSRQRKIYRVVKEAQRRAIKAVRAGRAAWEIDAEARGYIKKQGFGKYFVHSTGHGIGKKVHEAPRLSKGNRRRIRKGMVLTIEPGIYIKGWGGVRIEDMVLVTRRGCKVLTRTLK
jgi:Xaa-Pro aminopeptidase